MDAHLTSKCPSDVDVDHSLHSFMTLWPNISSVNLKSLLFLYILTGMAFSKRINIALVAGFRCSLLAEEMRHMGRHQQLIKNRRTQTNKVAANWRGKEGGRRWILHRSGMLSLNLVLLLYKRQLFPPAEQCKGWYCPWHGLGYKAHLEWTFPWWGVGAVTHCDFFFLQELCHGLSTVHGAHFGLL